jgi:hypothetical protein
LAAGRDRAARAAVSVLTWVHRHSRSAADQRLWRRYNGGASNAREFCCDGFGISSCVRLFCFKVILLQKRQYRLHIQVERGGSARSPVRRSSQTSVPAPAGDGLTSGDHHRPLVGDLVPIESGFFADLAEPNRCSIRRLRPKRRRASSRFDIRGIERHDEPSL